MITSCSKNEIEKEDSIQNTQKSTTNRTPTSASCESLPYTAHHAFGTTWSRTVNLPATGRFVEESHYVTTQDIFPNGRLFANTVTENISAHMQRSLALYQQYEPTKTFAQLFQFSYQKEWTPAEAGSIGQGSVGDIQKQELTPEKEMWFMTMMWAPGTKPAMGTKFLLSANGKKVVVVAGYETGPRSQTYLGGLTPETHAWLGTTNASQITVSYLKDQTTPIGPLNCSDGVVTTIPSPNTPAAGANVNSPISLSWSSNVSGGSYRIQISKVNTGWTAANGFTTDTAASSNIPVNYSTPGLLNYAWPNADTATINRPVSGTTYYWTVRSFSPATGTSAYSPVRSFRVN